MTEGAGTQHFAVGGLVAASRSPRVRLLGRWMIQTWSRSSTAMPPTCPSVQLFGNGFGQNGSTSNFGTGTAGTSAAGNGATGAGAPCPIAMVAHAKSAAPAENPIHADVL